MRPGPHERNEIPMDDAHLPQDLTDAAGRRDFLKGAVGAGMGVAALAAAATAEAAPSSAHLIVYHAEERRSHRVLWLMEELGLPYQLVFKPGDLRASMELAKAAHPMAMFPTIVDGDLHMVESGAILQYLASKYGGDRLTARPGSANYANFLMWMHFAEGSASPRIVADYTIRSIPDAAKASPFAGFQIGGAERVLHFQELTLAKTPYIAGPDFTAADIMMHFPVKAARLWGVDLQGVYPNTHAWMGKMESRPGFLKAVAKGSPNGPLVQPAGIAQPLLAQTGKGKA
jgi:glutathione S-transferase